MLRTARADTSKMPEGLRKHFEKKQVTEVNAVWQKWPRAILAP